MAKPRPLSDVLEELVEKMNLGARIDAARVVEAWAALAGPRVNGMTDKAWYRHGRLYIKIRSAAWRQELVMRREQWRTALNEELGEELVDEILFR